MVITGARVGGCSGISMMGARSGGRPRERTSSEIAAQIGQASGAHMIATISQSCELFAIRNSCWKGRAGPVFRGKASNPHGPILNVTEIPHCELTVK